MVHCGGDVNVILPRSPADVVRSACCAGLSPARRLPHLFPAPCPPTPVYTSTRTVSPRHFAALFVVT